MKFDNTVFQFRTIAESDLPFLEALYATTRADELAMVPWSEQQKTDFIAMQFNAQHTFYQQEFSSADFNVVSKGNIDIGRLYVDARNDEMRIIDIALLPNFQGLGFGKKLLLMVMDTAKQGALPVTIHVEKNNPAMALYKRLGFQMVEDQGVYDLMQWVDGE